MCVLNLYWLYIIIAIIECAVLDPALYLSPSPPLIETSKDISSAEIWSKQLDEKVVNYDDGSSDYGAKNEPNEKLKEATEPIEILTEESMKSSETIWPLFRNVDYSVRGIHVPLSFDVSGTYGNNHRGIGVISSSYGSIPTIIKTSNNTDKPSLAGSEYGGYQSRYLPGRIYGRGNKPAWTGWGNGKWGHYGTG